MKKQFDINKITYKDLDKKEQVLKLNNREFCTILWSHANSIDVDHLSHELHGKGKAKINVAIVQELQTLLPQFYGYRIVKIIIDYAKSLLTKDELKEIEGEEANNG